MPSFSELAPREKRIEIIRWICVLPAAMLGELATTFVFRTLVRTASPGGLSPVDDSPVLYWLVASLSHALPAAAFVVSGAKTAPRRQFAGAITLAILGVGRSLLKHILVQHIAGNVVGRTNYVHFAAEAAGLVCGAAYLAFESGRYRGKP